MAPLLCPEDLGYEPMDCSDSTPSPAEGVKRPSRRTVRFTEDLCTVREIESIDNNDLERVRELWFQPQDMIEGKKALRSIARNWRQTGLGILLDDTFKDPNPLLCQKRLNAFTQLPDEIYVRGLERHLSKQHDMQRTGKKRSNIQDVLAQARSLDLVKNMPLEEKQNVLSLFSLHLSRDAEVFARRLGKADEVAVLKGVDPTAADIMCNYLKQLEREQKMEQHRKQQQQQQQAGNNAPPKSKPVPSIGDMRYQARLA